MGHQKTPIQPLSALNEELRVELVQLYDALSIDLKNQGAICNMCGECCNFYIYDHELWLTNVELTHLLHEAGQPPAGDPGLCPYMKGSLCTAREGRALGCRIFHCKIDKDAMEALHEKYLHLLRKICSRHNVEVEYGELLSSLP